MQVKCIRLLDSQGREVEFSPWLTLGRIYHVMTILIGSDGKRSYRVISSQPEGEWPQMAYHAEECFEVVSKLIPSNWREIRLGESVDIAPAAWQEDGFMEAFYDHEPSTYPIFERERDTIVREDPTEA